MTATDPITLGEGRTTASQIADIADGAPVQLSDSARTRIASSRDAVLKAIADGVRAYGVNTGLGPARDQPIPPQLQTQFQLYTLKTHAAGVGDALTAAEVRAIVAARLAVIAQGSSGASDGLVDGLLALLNQNITPLVPSVGSVGSADMPALAAIGLTLIGEGQALGVHGEPIPAIEALKAGGVRPVVFEAKDALALVGANSGSIGLGCLAWRELGAVAAAADLAGAHTVTIVNANQSAFREDVLGARPHAGQIRSGARLRHLLTDDPKEGPIIRHLGPSACAQVAGHSISACQTDAATSHSMTKREDQHLPKSVPGEGASLQDRLSIRTLPQVNGALLDELDSFANILSIELNSAAENPWIDPDSGDFVSNGNFSSGRLAIRADSLRVALALVGQLSERRTAAIVASIRSARPIAEQVGDPSTFGAPPVIIAQSAAELAVQLQHLANPVSVFPTVVGDGVEDHNCGAYLAIKLLRESGTTLLRLLAVEVLAGTFLSAQTDTTFGPQLAEFASRAKEATATGTVAEAVSAIEEALRSWAEEN
ncbi:MAG: aromatic amino acid lyase [Propionibacteriaceae bacterium]|nr:aromatic amino acid lyase [Propionibacteriaceae bacterium]